MYTEGIKKLVDAGPVMPYSWLLDLMAEKQRDVPFTNHSFQIWTLRTSDGMGHLSVTTDEQKSAIWSRHFKPCEGPPLIEFWMDQGTVMLPGEYKP